MATVHLAVDRQTGDTVALKVLHRHLADRPSARRRLERELEAARRVQHPAILHPLEQVEWEGSPALVLPALSGATLADRVEGGGALDVGALEELLHEVGGALAAAHAAGVLHRDVTPRNVLCDERFRLTDFGLARLTDQGTATTGALGTIGYAAPETYAEGARDPAADAYALGAVLYFAATSRPPFDAPTAMGALQLQLDGRHLPLASLRPDLPADLRATIENLLAPEPADRPSVPEALRRITRPSLDVVPRRRRQWTQVGTTISLIAGMAVGWGQDLGAFLLATIVQGYAVPSGDIHQMTQGVSAMVLAPLSLAPAFVGGVLGRNDPDRRVGPRVGIALLFALNITYAVLAGVVAPEMGMGDGMNLVGTMLFHMMAYVPLSALIVIACRPWLAWSAEAAPTPSPRVPLAEEADRALGQLRAALSRAPQAIRLDLAGTVRELQAAVTELGAELGVVDEALAAAAVDPGLMATLEARRARAEARGEATADHERASEAHRRLIGEVDALEQRRVRAVARLLEIRAEAACARRAVLDDSAAHVTTSLRDLRERARLASQARAEVG
jgi:hypothetical protein